MSNFSFAVALIAGFFFALIGGVEQCMSANAEGHHALLQTSNVRKKSFTNGVASEILAQPYAGEADEAVGDMADAIKTLGEVGADQTSAETFAHRQFMLSTVRALKLAGLDASNRADSKTGGDVPKYYVFSQHKTGTVMGCEAVVRMNEVHSGLDILWHSGLGSATSELEIPDPMEKSCFLHTVRNPFEMLVSGYLYHKAESEDWVLETFGQALAEITQNNVTRDSAVPWQFKAYNGIAQVFHESRNGPLSDWLPDAQSNERFADFLNRLDPDRGLVVEYILARESNLPSMLFTFNWVAQHSCSLNVCLHSFYEQCSAVWQHVFRTWQIQEPHYSSLLHAVEKSCPHVSNQTLMHSSGQLARDNEKTHEHPPEHELVNRLRDLDKNKLNGTIAQIEKEMSLCQVSGKYKELPATAEAKSTNAS